MEVVNSVKGETLQSKFDKRVSEVTDFNLTAKDVDTSEVDDYVNTLKAIDYSNWTEFMEVVNSVKEETLQSKFDARVEEVTKFVLTKAVVDTSAVDNYVETLVETDYTNWSDFMAKVNDVKSEELQSVFNDRVSEVTGFALTAKTVDKSAVDNYISTLVEADYEEDNWNAFMEIVNSVKGETLQSEFDKRVEEVTGFDLEAKQVDKTELTDYLKDKYEIDYTEIGRAHV